MLRIVERVLVLVHRYVGIVVGPLMLLWCLTGMVMMYAPYPQLTESDRTAHLSPLRWDHCCRVGYALGSSDAVVDRFQVEMLGDQPILRASNGAGAGRLISLTDGSPVGVVSKEQALSVAAAYASKSAAWRSLDRIDHDQWTVQGAHGPDRPLIKFSDEEGTEVYVSSVTGKAVQKTQAGERLLNWVGAVPHWLYFTELRQNGALWAHVVVWASAVGSFLALLGVYIGIRQFRPRPGGKWLPYRGFHYWHHTLGLVFGVFVLTWVVSGLVSMNPWGFLEGGKFEEPDRLRATQLSASRIAASIEALGQSVPPNVVSVTSAPLQGELYWVATRADGSKLRLDAKGMPAPLSPADWDFIAQTLAPSGSFAPLEKMDHEDTYYFSHHRDHAELPSYRLIANDAQRTRYYLDPVSGEIRAKFDGDKQKYRWLHQGLHRLDFSPFWRSRPLWDVLMLSLLMGASLVCALGTYIGIRGLTR